MLPLCTCTDYVIHTIDSRYHLLDAIYSAYNMYKTSPGAAKGRKALNHRAACLGVFWERSVRITPPVLNKAFSKCTIIPYGIMRIFQALKVHEIWSSHGSMNVHQEACWYVRSEWILDVKSLKNAQNSLALIDILHSVKFPQNDRVSPVILLRKYSRESGPVWKIM